ncbi:MAG TPA: Type 1 glutamine amidotransferase-like domain-containing protein [Anaerolineales bacterium]|nr:Type 1 glutamine amidotransferase-like domain-containing protein [Anaerolineales bacterium]HNN12931.1 Type 1 glutamine amidotransferase-like domain-containing protein [Anaerolineales bacterium]HNO30317.1 Type 1 glutamine amidotransferase-like domain-containing protein [Anaerolineales bacterium]
MGGLLLAGGAEFGGQMAEPDLLTIELAGGFDTPICILPTAAAPDKNHKRAGNHGVRWFQSLGAKNAFTVDVIDSKSANTPALADQIRRSKLIYLLGGFPRYLGETLAGSLCWQAALDAYQEGAVLAGSSAGAMVLCEHYYDPYEKKVLPGLNLVPNACVLPHHNTFGRSWVDLLRRILPGSLLIGIDEQTGMVRDMGGEWAAVGRGEVTLYRSASIRGYGRGGRFSF